jgi:hypothetical protein
MECVGDGGSAGRVGGGGGNGACRWLVVVFPALSNGDGHVCCGVQVPDGGKAPVFGPAHNNAIVLRFDARTAGTVALYVDVNAEMDQPKPPLGIASIDITPRLLAAAALPVSARMGSHTMVCQCHACNACIGCMAMLVRALS